MNIISDRLYAPPGSVYEHKVYVNNGRELTRDLFGKIGAYVMQDDVLLESLTPRECLYFSANLRLACSPEEKKANVDHVIAALGLSTCVDTLVLLSLD